MNELESIEQELTANLSALDEKPCNCHESNDNPFSSGEFSSDDELMNELQTALNSLNEDSSMAQLTAEEAMEFASVADYSDTGLSDLISVLEQNPGLKITLSF